MKVIIDTNVVIDYLANREEFRENAALVSLFTYTPLVEAYFTTTTVTTIYYILHQYFHDSTLVKKMLSSWDFNAKYLTVTGKDCMAALNSEVSDYEDAVMAEAAFREHIDYIITRNTKDFKYSKVRAVTPEEFIPIFLRSDFSQS